jgi:hypothetical protein
MHRQGQTTLRPNQAPGALDETLAQGIELLEPSLTCLNVLANRAGRRLAEVKKG